MKCKFKVGDKVQLKSNPTSFSIDRYRFWNVHPNREYTVMEVGGDLRLDNGYYVAIEDMEISYLFMLKKVLE